ncbi:factor-independent urate hydroxylase [Nocardioides speluncae]|uniref:factor-independent urate hydroxylase n=1 Tax=Nocardioides speluncae TaxID=2670337 RepID=UPI001F0C6F8B|nr:urate oxidase [Nocardioides speluncae]
MVRLGPNQYGKAENRVVRVYRDTDVHVLRDLNVSTSLRGDFEAAHIAGDQRDVLPTDTQKNTAFAFAKEEGVRAIEEYALTLGRHFLTAAPAATGARIAVEEYPWERVGDHSFVRAGGGVRTTVVEVSATDEIVVSGIKDLVLMNTTGSEFKGFLKDAYTTLQETDDRILATSLETTWRYTSTGLDFDTVYAEIRRLLITTFAETHSLALQQTLYAMGEAVLSAVEDVAEISFSAPNKHHLLVDLSPFGVGNPGEVFIAADRPYGLIEATVVR